MSFGINFRMIARFLFNLFIFIARTLSVYLFQYMFYTVFYRFGRFCLRAIMPEESQGSFNLPFPANIFEDNFSAVGLQITHSRGDSVGICLSVGVFLCVQ